MTENGLGALLRDAVRLERDTQTSDDDLARRLRDSVIAPLQTIAGTPPDDAGTEAGGTTAERLRGLAVKATELRGRAAGHASTALKEATAALQTLAIHTADGEAAVEVAAELRGLLAGVGTEMEVAKNGPYLGTNVTLYDWLGVRIPCGSQVALCRCGASTTKPFCDGSHTSVGFSGDKEADRVPDRRDTYKGVHVTVLDNRGICAHSGFCTDRVSSVFRLGQEPFVAPSGARMDEIVGAVRACPSGALSFAIDGEEQRHVVDQQREPAVEVSKDGPYRITGGIVLVEEDGTPVKRDEGVSLEHYSLCRCGHSKNKPFCSGMHWTTSFKDPVPSQDSDVTLFEWAGGLPGLTRVTKLFYEKYVPQDPLIGPLFASMSPDHPVRVAKWLGEVFGGPSAYTDEYGGYSRMISQHLGKGLTEPQRARWVALMCQAADQGGLPADAEFRAAFVAYLEWGSRIALENSQKNAHPPQGMPVPHWWWVCNATPTARVSALAPVEETTEPSLSLPASGETVSFETHIKPLFRTRDRNSMKFAFDLWSYEDVKTHADAILGRLRSGSMPCDGRWPAEWLSAFEQWITTDMAE